MYKILKFFLSSRTAKNFFWQTAIEQLVQMNRTKVLSSLVIRMKLWSLMGLTEIWTISLFNFMKRIFDLVKTVITLKFEI